LQLKDTNLVETVGIATLAGRLLSA
jgi:hypothetical protein